MILRYQSLEKRLNHVCNVALRVAFTVPIVAGIAAHAQTAPPAQVAGSDQLMEIVVKAEKRAENVQRVPIAITAFTALSPSTPIIIISASEDPVDVRRALDLGALGYAPKSSPPETLVSAVQLVMAGGIYVPPLMLIENEEVDG